MNKKHSQTNFQGYIQVYTGKGKGKTTAALGLALRAAGRGLKTYIAQFLKAQPSGEVEASLKLSPDIKIERFGRTGFIEIKEGSEPEEDDIRLARFGLFRALEAMLSGDYQIIILDEINVAVHLKIISEQELLDFISRKPPGVELVLTGRNAPERVIEIADLVTEMKEIKHYYNRGVKARPGIEK